MRDKIAKSLELWPIFLLACVYYVSWFNPDFFIAPILIIKYKWAKPLLVLVIGSIGFMEMLGGYKGWSGTRGLIIDKWLKDKEFVKKLRGEERAGNLVEGLEIRLTRKYLKFTDNKEYYEEPVSKVWLFRNIDKVLKWMVLILKSGGVIAMFVFGLVPVPGFRIVPDVLCGTARWKVGFTALAVGNFLKTVGIIYGWNWFLS
ncbi:MAG: hypothetical protein HYX22_03680 [Candidatus Yanofskybacteria bacterium]|nr:hypothetical protein [Candidatus Yanofskybacteria bacterium]